MPPREADRDKQELDEEKAGLEGQPRWADVPVEEARAAPAAPGRVVHGRARPGDWLCPSGDHQFAKNENCRRCRAVKPMADPPGEPAAKARGAAMARAAGKDSQGRFLSGAWACPSCGNHQSRKNDRCRTCHAARPAAGAPSWEAGDWECPHCGAHQPAGSAVCGICHAATAAVGGTTWKAGDWECPSCGDHQFARNVSCRSCGSLRA